jgi:hypothetical protein
VLEFQLMVDKLFNPTLHQLQLKKKIAVKLRLVVKVKN